MTAPSIPGAVISKLKMVAGPAKPITVPITATALTAVTTTAITAFTVFIEGIIAILLKNSASRVP